MTCQYGREVISVEMGPVEQREGTRTELWEAIVLVQGREPSALPKRHGWFCRLLAQSLSLIHSRQF